MNVTVKLFRRLLALVVAGALAATAVAALAGGSASSAADPDPATPKVSPWAPIQSAAELEDAFEANFALLRSPGGDSIPATAPIDDPGLEVAESRQLDPPAARALARASTTGDADPEPPDATVWVVPKDDGTQCLLAYLPDVQQLGGNCAYPSDAVTGRMVMTLSRTGQDAEIYGLVPDGVDEVTVELLDGSRAVLPVANNTYMAQFDEPTASVSWIDGDGVEQSARIGSGG